MDDFLEMIEELLEDTGFSIYDPEMAPDILLECPCGNVIETDGKCPEGCVSPLREKGLI